MSFFRYNWLLYFFSEDHKFIPLECLFLSPHKFSLHLISKYLDPENASRKLWLISIPTVNSCGLYILWNLNIHKRSLIFPFDIFRTGHLLLASTFWLSLISLPTILPISYAHGIEKKEESQRVIIGYAEAFSIKQGVDKSTMVISIIQNMEKALLSK